MIYAQSHKLIGEGKAQFDELGINLSEFSIRVVSGHGPDCRQTGRSTRSVHGWHGVRIYAAFGFTSKGSHSVETLA